MAEFPEVIVVCTGNSCRSPMGARLLAHALAAEAPPLRDVVVSSAGISAFSGDPASANSVKALKKVGLDLSDHRSRRLSEHMVDNALAVFVMTEGHRNYLRSLLPDTRTPILLYRERMGGNADVQVPDPYGATLDLYEDTRDALAEAVPSLVAYLRERLRERE